jgi:hypothetical protein
VSTFTSGLFQLPAKILQRSQIALYGGGLLSAMAVWLGTSHTAAILQSATGQTGKGNLGGGGPDLFSVVNGLLGPALIIVVALAPLAIAWGAGMMIFGGKHGPQIMAGAIVAVVLVAAAKGIAA